jgi:small subunit ribosomal protein S14
MASKAAIAKQKIRKEIVIRNLEKRENLLMDGQVEKVRTLSRSTSSTRLRNRCEICGRSRGYIRRLQMCRICARHKALNGELPGIRKISW